jgi:hypothetical protein
MKPRFAPKKQHTQGDQTRTWYILDLCARLVTTAVILYCHCTS